MSFNANLSNCDIEPIHIPGKIQSHGFLIATDKEYHISCCSENVSDFIPVTAAFLLQQPLKVLEQHITAGSPDFLTQILKLGASIGNFDNFNPYTVNIGDQSFNMIISTSGNQYLLEFEPEYSDLNSDVSKTIGYSLSEILSDAQLHNLLQKAATKVQEIICYERVMIYKFHKDGHGEVVAEQKSSELDSLMGLHYPASDIPKQARELYKLNHIRLISDVQIEPSAIITSPEFADEPLDLSHGVLRAVSPIHIQYLKNMGVASSFSISLVDNNELWGLIACHNYSPRFINYKERVAARLIGQVLSSAVSSRQKQEDLIKSNQIKEAIIILGKGLIRNENIEKTLFNNPITLLDAVDATGVALYFNNQWYTEGTVADEKFLSELSEWLSENMEMQVYETNELPLVYPDALRYKDIASGILACVLSKELKEYIIWFRPEVIKSVKWAGNPEKPAIADSNGLLTITPRKSFEVWVETVQFSCVPWEQEDLKSALLVREEIAFAISRKAIEVRILNEKLKEAYEELNAFSYTISHDLKTPLTSIKSFGQLLKRNASLNEQGQHMVDRIILSAAKMQTMIEEVLRYSMLGMNKSSPNIINMKNLLEELKEEFLAASDQKNLQIHIDASMEIYGDQTMVMQVFSNLIGNAIKYSKQSAFPIVHVKCAEINNGIQYSVVDNGIGIKLIEQGKVFDLFARSEEVKEYEGTGVGLSIVKKIMEKHNGKVWIESNPVAGTTFHVRFNKPERVSI